MFNWKFIVGLMVLLAIAGFTFAQFFTIEKTEILSSHAGHKLAKKLCAECHDIKGDGPSPNKASPPFGVLANRYPVDQLEEAFGEGALVGHSEMPTFELKPRQLTDLLEYIGSLKKQQTPAQ